MSGAVSKARGIAFDLSGGAPAKPAPGSGLVTGVMQHAMGSRELVALREQVKQLEGERGAQLMDAATIRPSRWANRHESSLQGAEFEALKAEIADAGGNVQPIKVRPLAGAGEGGARYEVVFGHRRHRACLELGLPVLAVVQELDDRELWTQMERENRGRKGLSAWEQGAMYRRALDAGLFPSLRMLAQAIGSAPGTVSKAMTIADLPAEVVAAFPSPTEIQFRWAAELRRALDANEAAVLAAARSQPPGQGAGQVFAALMAAGVSPGKHPKDASAKQPPAPAEKRLAIGRGTGAMIRTDGKRTVLELESKALPPERWEAFEAVLKQFFGR